jgi:hypothetical protein
MTEKAGHDRSLRRAEFAKELARLRERALQALEEKGHDVRGKSPAQIRAMLRGRRSRRKRTNLNQISISN